MRLSLIIVPGLFILLIFSCCDPFNRKSHVSDQNIQENNATLVTAAREHLYENQYETADSLLQLVDTLLLDEDGFGFYYLTTGFLNHQTRN